MPDQTIKEKEPAVGRKISGLRTLKTDVDDYVKREGVLGLATASMEKRGAKNNSKKGFPLKIIAFILAGVLFVGGIFGGLFFLLREKGEEPVISPSVKTILISDDQSEVLVDSSRTKVSLNSIITALQKPVTINHLLNVSVVKQEGEDRKPLGLKDFFKTIGTTPPLQLLDSLENRFMLSKFYFSKEWPILIFKIKSYDSAFLGMIKWEKEIASDLEKLLLIKEGRGSKDFFVDKEIQNRDTRILKDKNNEMLLVYSFINRNYLVITTGEEPLKEMFRRFSSAQYLND